MISEFFEKHDNPNKELTLQAFINNGVIFELNAKDLIVNHQFGVYAIFNESTSVCIDESDVTFVKAGKCNGSESLEIDMNYGLKYLIFAN